jgi:hypothetical protein
VLEHFVEREEADPEERSFEDYFDRLGYSWSRVRGVLITFLRAGLLFSRDGVTPKQLVRDEELHTGPLVCTRTAIAYWDKLLGYMWYYVMARRGTRFPIDKIEREWVEDGDNGYEREYITNRGFVEWLKEEEEEERHRIRSWERENPPQAIHLRPAHILASRALRVDTSEGEDAEHAVNTRGSQ